MSSKKSRGMKLTKRKAFKFYRSYFDVYMMLNDEDKVQFIDALLNREFFGEEPEGLSPMAKMAYISQEHNIDSQVLGYVNQQISKGKNKEQVIAPPPTKSSVRLRKDVPQLQNRKKTFDEFWKVYDYEKGLNNARSLWQDLEVETHALILAHIKNYVASTPNKKYRKTPANYLMEQTWLDEVIVPDNFTGMIGGDRYRNGVKQMELTRAQQRRFFESGELPE